MKPSRDWSIGIVFALLLAVAACQDDSAAEISDRTSAATTDRSAELPSVVDTASATTDQPTPEVPSTDELFAGPRPFAGSAASIRNVMARVPGASPVAVTQTGAERLDFVGGRFAGEPAQGSSRYFRGSWAEFL